MSGIRNTDARVASHRRYVVETFVTALRDAFSNTYDRDPQLADIKITNQFPLKESDYPCIMVEYESQRVLNAGVGHEEWFDDATGELQRWFHNRFEGILNFHVQALTPLDRDLMADALEEVIRFGPLDSQLAQFFTDIYGDQSDNEVHLLFSQLMLNSDELTGSGNTASMAPWTTNQDMLVFETSVSCELHGGFYNIVPDVTWGFVTKVTADSYPEGDVTIEFDLNLPFTDPTKAWTNPFVWEDFDTVVSTAVISGQEA